MVGALGPITSSGYTCVADVLQYTEYAVMIPFFWVGGAHAAESLLPAPETGTNEKPSGWSGAVLK